MSVYAGALLTIATLVLFLILGSIARIANALEAIAIWYVEYQEPTSQEEE